MARSTFSRQAELRCSTAPFEVTISIGFFVTVGFLFILLVELTVLGVARLVRRRHRT